MRTIMSAEQELSRGDELPENYTPKSLRGHQTKPRQVTYAIGIRHGASNMGMAHGPYPSLQTALEVVPEHAASCVVRYTADGTDEVLYRWDRTNDRWVRE
jgi:hypothetical protein